MTIPARFLRFLGFHPRTYHYKPAKPSRALQALSLALKAQAFHDKTQHPAGWSR
jgi:hypothetical protein